MEDAEDFDSVAAHAVGDQVRSIGDHQLAGALDAPGAGKARFDQPLPHQARTFLSSAPALRPQVLYESLQYNFSLFLGCILAIPRPRTVPN
jgi:hypothetical protein